MVWGFYVFVFCCFFVLLFVFVLFLFCFVLFFCFCFLDGLESRDRMIEKRVSGLPLLCEHQ